MLPKKLKYYYNILISQSHFLKNYGTEASKKNLLAAELSRNIHSIEKGMTIENPRLGFGQKKLEDIFRLLDSLSNSADDYHREVCQMAVDAMKDYLAFHQARSFRKDFFTDVENAVAKYDKAGDHKSTGGTLMLEKKDLQFDIPAIETFFRTRHSIRDFDASDVDDEKLLKALKLAQTTPSACNRQAVRAYVLNPERNQAFIDQLSGIGGFAGAVKRFIVITGKTSAYRLNEINQYIVSAGMYAAYLTLTLHLYGFGACVVQRPVIWTQEWESNRKSFGIPEDEQLICLLAVGNLKESCTVPLSYRLENKEMIRFL